MESKKIEWFEIIEPCTKEEIYVNMYTGECVWHPPAGALIKKSDDTLWWEIFDPNTSRFYYYNSKSQRTMWQKPQNSDVLSLSKLQALKQTISDTGCGEAKKESTATQTTTKISAKNLQKNPMYQKCVSTQTTPSSTSPRNEKIRHGYSSLSEHTLSTYSYDSGCSGDSSMASHSHSSLDSTNYCFKKLEFCSAESVDSTYFQDQNILQPRVSWQESKQWEKRNTRMDFKKVPSSGSAQRPMLSNLVPVWQQHSFEGWRAPSRTPPKQHSLDSTTATRRHMSQQFFHTKGKSCINFNNVSEQKKRSTPQHYRKVHSKNSLSFDLDQIKHTSGYTHENNSSYPPEAVGTPLASRRQWLVRSAQKSQNGFHKSENIASSPQNPLMPLENLQSFKRSKVNVHIPKYEHNAIPYKQQSLDLPLNCYNTRNVQRKEDRYIPELILPLPKPVQHKTKISPDFKFDSYSKPLSRQRYYNSCKHIYENDIICTTPEYNMPCCYQAENYLSPLQQYLMEQAQISGKLTDYNDDKDSFSQSDDSDGARDDDDHFADDEGMSHHDSSSLEYLDNYRFFEGDYEELFYHPPTLHSSYRKGKSDLQLSCSKPLNGRSDPPLSSPIFCHRDSSQHLLPSYYDSIRDRSDEHLERNTAEEEEEDDEEEEEDDDDDDEGKSSNGDIQKYAEDNLNRHTKGIFRKKFSLQDMLSWSKDPIRKPMIMTTDKSLKKDACEVFKLIQTYMLDHKAKSGQTYEAVVLDIATRGWSKPALRDELYIQICRQTTENPKRESLVLGWELMAVCLTFFPPSSKFQPYLEGYIKKHQSSSLDPPDLKISQYALVCGKRLEQISHKGAARSLRKPNVEEIEQSRVQIFRPSMFGNSLEEVMSLQRKRYPTYRLPWVQTTLSEAVLQLNGAQTEGIFRVPGDVDEINSMKMRIDLWEVMECDDPHVPASLLKQWYRELFEPLIPAEYYEECITYCNDSEASIQIVKNLPELNRLVFSYLIRFLQVFAAEENCAVTKMDAKNLAMVMAPNCLRCTSEDPTIIFENTRKEMAFIQTLIQHLNTGYMEGII